jgi:hypothetical protein
VAGFYTVKQGDWLASIAHQFGIPDWHTIWNLPQNQDLRNLRKSPNILFPGDQVYVPDIKPGEVTRATDQSHQFVRRKDKQPVRLQLFDGDKQPRVGVPYTFQAGNVTGDAETTAAGMVEQDVALDITSAVLTIDNQAILLRLGHLDPIEETSGVQARLANLGYDPGEIDGIYGPKTKAAIMAFQRECPPLKVDGICGQKTRQKLLEVYGC